MILDRDNPSSLGSLFAKHAQIIYSDDSWEINNFFRNQGALKSEFFNKNETECAIAHDGEDIIIVFRGTESYEDVLTDLNCCKLTFSVGKVHKGFYIGLEKVLFDISRYIDACFNNQSIWLIGHSLGGALATLYSYYLIESCLDQYVKGIYTYGSPRVGDVKFALYLDKYYNSVMNRYVNNNDIITRIPTRLMGYSHVNDCHYIDVDGKVHEDPSYWDTFLDRVQGRFENFKIIGDGGVDHFIDNYIKQLS